MNTQDTIRKKEFTDLLDEHRGKLRKVVLTYGLSRDDQEDLSQEMLVQLWRSFGSYDSSRPFATWMYRVALNVAISHVRRVAKLRRERGEASESQLDPPDLRQEEDGADDRLLILQRLMASLDELDRALLLLHLEDRSYSEIAEVLGLTESNVGTKLNRLRDRLRKMATKELKR